MIMYMRFDGESVERYRAAAERLDMSFGEWVEETLDVASDPESGGAVMMSAGGDTVTMLIDLVKVLATPEPEPEAQVRRKAEDVERWEEWNRARHEALDLASTFLHPPTPFGSWPPTPFGSWVRLDPEVDVASLDLPLYEKQIAAALQKYGMFLRDSS